MTRAFPPIFLITYFTLLSNLLNFSVGPGHCFGRNMPIKYYARTETPDTGQQYYFIHSSGKYELFNREWIARVDLKVCAVLSKAPLQLFDPKRRNILEIQS